MKDIVVIGAGQAGASLCAKLRQMGYDEKLSLFGEEVFPPYQRPPLSKKYLLGEIDVERLYIRPKKFYSEQDIDLNLNSPISKIDIKKKVIYSKGNTTSFDQLIFTTGSTPRKLPKSLSQNLKNIFYVRSILDVNYMAPNLVEGKKVLIIGGGYIGLEAASVCRKLGVNVKIIEMDKRILNRVSSSETANYFRELHQNNGVEILERVTLDALIGETHVEKAILSDGTQMNIDLVIAGIGVLPNDNLATEAGLDIENGIKTNSLGQTSNESIWAAGDCSSFPWRGKRIRLESVQNAIDQSEIVAENILGEKKSYIPSPWFWSDQYDVKLQIAGLNTGYDQIAVRKGDRDNSVSHWYYKSGTLISVDAMNDPRSYMIGKRIIESGNVVSPTDIENPEYDLKKLIKK